MKRKLLIRCDAGAIPEIGTGHLRRCRLLADALREKGSEIVFLTASAPEIAASLRSAGYACRELPPGDAVEDVLAALREEKPEIVVWDRLDTREDLCRAIKGTGALLITFDDQGPGQKFADITINAMVEGGETAYKGPEYAILPKLSPPALPAEPRPVRRILVSFGGYDHAGATAKVAKALASLDARIQIQAVVGPSSPEPGPSPAPNVSVLRAPPDFSELLKNSDLALVAGGLTLVEALANGVPCLAAAQYDHQARTIARFEKEGAVASLGRALDLDADKVLEATRRLAADGPGRLAMARKARRLVDGQGLERVRELCAVVDRLDWDSGFFGVEIAYLHPRLINENIVRYALRKCGEAGIQCLYYLCDCHDPRSVALAEKNGFHFVDIRLTFSHELGHRKPAEAAAPLPFTLRDGAPGDVPQLVDIASTIYVHSRYYFDRHFSKELCQKFYAEWIAKSLKGYADKVLVAEKDGRVLGYTTCKMLSPITGGIPLVGVAAHAAGGGVGKALVGRALDWFKERGALTAEVVTQGRNYAAQRLYQSCGFRTLKTELWYHKWFEDAA